MNAKCIVLRPGKPAEWDVITGLKDLQGHVGGLIEAAPICPEVCTVYVNEEGKLKDLPPNRLWMHEGHVHDVLVGTMVVLGPPDEDGDDTDATPEMLATLETYLN